MLNKSICELWAYLMKVIPKTYCVNYILTYALLFLPLFLTMSVSDKGYFRNVSCAIYSIFKIVIPYIDILNLQSKFQTYLI